MNRRTPFLVTWLLVSLILFSTCTGNKKKSHPEYNDSSSLIDSITVKPTKSGKYTLASEFFENLTTLRQAQGSDSAHTILFTFFSRLHPDVRITDSLAVRQMVEWISNCFTMMDSGGVFFTNGDADTYAAWYLQRVEKIRQDLTVVSLPFLVGPDYRKYLKEDTHSRKVLNLSERDSLPVPPSTSETQTVLADMVTRLVSQPKHAPLYMTPRCGIEDKFSGHIIYLGLIYAYQDSIEPQNQILDQLIIKLTKTWQLRYASKGYPKDTRYAARVAVIQYLSLLLIMTPKFEEQKRYQEMDTLFTYLEPILGQDWRFLVLRYKFCHRSKEECFSYLEKVKEYASTHPDEPAVQAVLKELENK